MAIVRSVGSGDEPDRRSRAVVQGPAGAVTVVGVGEFAPGSRGTVDVVVVVVVGRAVLGGDVDGGAVGGGAVAGALVVGGAVVVVVSAVVVVVS